MLHSPLVLVVGGAAVVVVGAARCVLTKPLAVRLRVSVGKRIDNIFIQIPHHVVAAGPVAGHVLGHAVGAFVHGVAAAEQ